MHLQRELEVKSAGVEEKVQRAFAAALEMQQQSAEEAATCKAELERKILQNKEEMSVLAQQVGRGADYCRWNHFAECAFYFFARNNQLFICVVCTGSHEAREASRRVRAQIY